MEIDSEEQEAPKDDGTYPSSLVVHSSDYQEESVEPIEPMDLPRDVVVIRKRLAQLCDTLQDVERHATPSGTFGESKRPQRFLIYMALMSHIIHFEHSSYEEATSQEVWKDAMMEEYHSIMKNDVWKQCQDLRGSQW